MREGQFVTGLIYHGTTAIPLDTQLNTVDRPLATLPESKVRPPKEVLDQVMQSLM